MGAMGLRLGIWVLIAILAKANGNIRQARF
jgi:hypothetical protein